MRERLLSALRNTKLALARKWWWWILLFLAQQLWEVAKHRVYGDINAAIDAHSTEFLQYSKPYILDVVKNPLLISLLVFIGLVCVIVFHAYVDTLPSAVNGVNKTKTSEDAKAIESAVATKVPNDVSIDVGLTID